MKSFLKSSVSALFAGYVAYAVLNYFVAVFDTDTFVTVLAQGALAGLAGLAGFVLLQYIFKSEELDEVMHMCKKRMVRKGEVVPPQDEDHLAV
jgi:hypothetical protein